MSIISTSKDANINYLCKIIKIKNLVKHPNADRLQTTSIDFNNVIVGADTKEGDVCAYFPIEAQINKELLSSINSFRKKELNKDKEAVGFFEDKGRVRAVKLRGERSMGVVFPLEQLEKFTGKDLKDYVGQEFDTIGDILICKKYVVPVRGGSLSGGKNGKIVKRISRLVDLQFRFHIDTENLRKNAYKIKQDDVIDISYKVHGSSFIVSNVLVKRKLNLFEKIFRKFGVNIEDKEYDVLWASRRVVKNQFETAKKNDFYGYDIWGEIANEIKEFIPKGYTVYGEVCGYTNDGGYIQKLYDYNCAPGKHRIFVYRITFTNTDGQVFNLSTMQMREFCVKMGLECVPLFFYGKAKDVFPEIKEGEHWHEEFIKKLEEKYTDKDCYICANKVSEEGIVLRKEKFDEFEAYKLKGFAFLENESKQLDSGEVDIESVN